MIGDSSLECRVDDCDECIDPGCSCNCHMPEHEPADLNWWTDDE